MPIISLQPEDQAEVEEIEVEEIEVEQIEVVQDQILPEEEVEEEMTLEINLARVLLLKITEVVEAVEVEEAVADKLEVVVKLREGLLIKAQVLLDQTIEDKLMSPLINGSSLTKRDQPTKKSLLALIHKLRNFLRLKTLSENHQKKNSIEK
jgi:hypothetical protein